MSGLSGWALPAGLERSPTWLLGAALHAAKLPAGGPVLVAQHAHSSDRDAAGCLSGKKAYLAALGRFGAFPAPRLLLPALPGSTAWHQQPWLPNELVPCRQMHC